MVEETEVPGENHRLPQDTDKLFKDLRKVDYTIFVLCATNKNVLRIFVVV